MKQKKLGEILVESGLISEIQLNKTLEILGNSEDLSIGQVLVREGFISQRDLNVALDYYDKRLKLGEILLSRKKYTIHLHLHFWIQSIYCYCGRLYRYWTG